MEKKKTILVVDDEEIVRDLLSYSLTEQGYLVLTAENGHAALEIFSTHNVACDLAIVDLSMPGMTGIEVCEKLKAIHPAQRVMLSTGSYSSEEDIEKLKNIGICHILRKPFNMIGLITLLKNELECQ